MASHILPDHRGIQVSGHLMHFLTVLAVTIVRAQAAETLGTASSPGTLEQSLGGSSSPVAQFKAFLSSPPCISNLVFAEKVPMEGSFRLLDGSLARSTRFNYFQAKWQTNGLLLRQISVPSDVTNFLVFGQLVSWSGHQHALLDKGGCFTLWDDKDPSTLVRKSSLLSTSHELRPLREILSLGIMHTKSEGVKWEGETFKTEGEFFSDHLVITGTIMPSEDGIPKALHVVYAGPEHTNDYVIRYGYGFGPRWRMPPMCITNFWLNKGDGGTGREIEMEEWRILAYEPTVTPLNPEEFSAAPFAKQNDKDWVTHVYTNGALYTVTTNGGLKLAFTIKDLENRSGSHLRDEPKLRAFYAIWAGTNLGIFALMLGAKEKNMHQRKN